MKVTEIRSDKIYKKILNAKLDKKDLLGFWTDI